MIYEELEKIIFKPCSMTMKNKGKLIEDKELVKGLRGKRIDNLYHIYGKVNVNLDGKSVNTHIILNLSAKKVVSYKCTCEKYGEFLSQGYKFFCEHISASAYKFLNSKENIKAKNTPEKPIENKIKVELVPRLTYKTIGESNYFEIDFSIEKGAMFNILNINNFIKAIDSDEKYKFNDNFTFSTKTHLISNDSKELINFIRIIYINSPHLIKHGFIKLEPKDIHLFFNSLKKKEIIFKNQYLEYKTNIRYSLLPLAINIKENNNSFIISSEKNLPIPMNPTMSILVFNRDFYILNDNSAKIFSQIYNKIKKNNCIYFPGNNSNLHKIISLFSRISSKINLADSIKKYLEVPENTKFVLSKTGNDIKCIIKINYGTTWIDILNYNSNDLSWIRNYKWEEKVLMAIESVGFIKKGKNLIFYGNDELLYNLLKNKNNTINSFGNIILSHGLEHLKIFDSKDLNGSIYEEDWAIKVSYGLEGVSPEDFEGAYKAFKNGRVFYKTKDGSFIDMQDENIINTFKFISLLDLEGDLWKGMSYIDKNKATILDGCIINNKLEWLLTKGNYESVLSKLSKLANLQLNIDTKLLHTLRDYQLIGAKWLNNLNYLGFGGILADEMGLGKTIQTIAFLNNKTCSTSLIVAPTSLIYNWLSEFNKFSPNLKVKVVHGNIEDRVEIIKCYKEYNVLLTTYGTLNNDIEFYKEINFDYCIIDEAQNIKNYKTKVSESVKKVKANVNFALTGTPIENNLMEIWSVFDFIMPGILFTKDEFSKKFNSEDTESLNSLKEIIAPFILRRTKADVANDLPEKIEKYITVPLVEKQKELYNNYASILRTTLNSNDSGELNILSYLTKLRQISLHPKLIVDTYEGDSGKFNVALKLIENKIKSHGKILVFSQFTSILNLFSSELNNKNICHNKITGNTSSKERLKIVNDFNSNPKVKVLLISLKAGGTGLNLTSANLVLHLDPWWNPSVEEQATDRAHRIGQKNVVEVVKLIAKDTIEEKILLLQEHKKRLIEDILTDKAIVDEMISKENLFNILKNNI